MAAAEQTLTPSVRSDRRYVGRFAPSPTGPLHFGSLVAAVASYADARAVGGRWLLRIEDVDQPRCSLAAEQRIRAQLAAYGFEHDGDVVRQSEQTARYADALQTLTRANAVYVCQCTRAQLVNATRNAEHEIIYPGACRGLRLVDAAGRAVRLRVSDDKPVTFTDRCYGPQQQNVSRDVGDFVLRRTDGWFAYQLAVVVDDAQHGVTDVVRGADLLGNTARQMLLQRALGYATLRYLHVPIVRNDNGEKLSKQTRAAAIDEDNALATLQEAWRFLQQEALGTVSTVAEFWRRAVMHWQAPSLDIASKCD